MHWLGILFHELVETQNKDIDHAYMREGLSAIGGVYKSQCSSQSLLRLPLNFLFHRNR